MEGGVLVPRRHQPVGGERGGQRSADDEAEVSGACGRDEARFGADGQRVDHRGGILAELRQRPAEGAAYGRRIRAGGYGPLVECGEKRLRVFYGSAEAGGAVWHEETLRVRTTWLRLRIRRTEADRRRRRNSCHQKNPIGSPQLRSAIVFIVLPMQFAQFSIVNACRRRY